MVIAKKSRFKILTGYFIIICVLFFLPGKALPKGNSWMDAIQFDKWVHFGIFAVLAFLSLSTVEIKNNKTLFPFFIMLILYGLAVELVQHHFVANRSFDRGDLAADAAGAAAGLLFWRYTKK